MLAFNGQRWPHPCEASLYIHVHEENASWSFVLDNWGKLPGPDKTIPMCDSLCAEFHLPAKPFRHWREVEGWELHVNPDWQDANEYINEDGNVCFTKIEAHHFRGEEDRGPQDWWQGEEFRFRFGSRDGDKFVFELEAWLVRKEEFAHKKPRAFADAAVPRGTPPNLWIMTQIPFAFFDVRVPTAIKDPVAWAKEKVRRGFGVRDFEKAHLLPIKRYNQETKQLEVDSEVCEVFMTNAIL